MPCFAQTSPLLASLLIAANAKQASPSKAVNRAPAQGLPPSLPKPNSKAANVPQQTEKQPATIPQAMAAGWSNDRIRSALKSGKLEDCRTPDEAARLWWPSSDIIEAKRRALIW